MAACPPAAPRAAEYAPPLALVEGLAGALGGVLGLALTHPLVVVSTRLQLQSRRDASPSVAAASSPPAPALAQPPARLPDGVLAAVLHLARAEGVGSLYRGLASGCASLFVSNALYHALYAALRDAWLRFVARRRKAVVEKAIGGAAALPVSAAAAALSVLLTAPRACISPASNLLWVRVSFADSMTLAVWTVTTRLQATKASLRAVLRDVYASGALRFAPAAPASHLLLPFPFIDPFLSNSTNAVPPPPGGLPAFWTGTWASLALVANPVVQFGCYEALLTRAPAAGLSPTDSRTARAIPPRSSHLLTFIFLLPFYFKF